MLEVFPSVQACLVIYDCRASWGDLPRVWISFTKSYSLAAQRLLGTHLALGSMPSTTKNKRIRKKSEEEEDLLQQSFISDRVLKLCILFFTVINLNSFEIRVPDTLVFIFFPPKTCRESLLLKFINFHTMAYLCILLVFKHWNY